MKNGTLLVLCGGLSVLAIGVGAAFADGVTAIPPNRYDCETTQVNQCYCQTMDIDPTYSCYGAGGPIYTCRPGGPTDNCDGHKVNVVCGGPDNAPTGDKYTGPCTETGGPGADQTKLPGKCSWLVGSCK